MTNFFDKVDFTPDDVTDAIAKAKEAAKAATRPDGRVCICGHGTRSHSPYSLSENGKYLRDRGIFKCSPGRVKCPCMEFRPVAVTSDIRKFTCKTEGPAERHALSKGAVSVVAGGGTVEWLDGVGCDRCKRTDVSFVPVSYSVGYYESSSATPMSRLVCPACRQLTQDEAVARTALAPNSVTS